MAWWVVVFVLMVCFEGVFDWEIVWVVFAIDWWDSLSCLFWRFVFWVFLIEWLCGLFVDVILFWFFIERLWFGEEEEKFGRTVHCNAAVVKPCVKMSARWFKRLIFWFGGVLFVVKTFSCSERRFVSSTS